MSEKTRRRRIYVVDPGFQYWLIGRMAVLSALIAMASLVLFAFVYGVLLSHRMAGPVFRIRKILHQMAEGDLSLEFSLRKKDAFKPLAESVIRGFE